MAFHTSGAGEAMCIWIEPWVQAITMTHTEVYTCGIMQIKLVSGETPLLEPRPDGIGSNPGMNQKANTVAEEETHVFVVVKLRGVATKILRGPRSRFGILRSEEELILAHWRQRQELAHGVILLVTVRDALLGSHEAIHYGVFEGMS